MSEEWKEKLAQKRLQTCRYYNGSARPECKAGVNYEGLTGGGLGWARRLPCYLGSKFTDVDQVVSCSLREFPTREEVDTEIDDSERSMLRSVKARQAIIDHLKATGQPTRNVSGNIACPNCGGTLRFSIAYNGHCHGQCSTSHCASWME